MTLLSHPELEQQHLAMGLLSDDQLKNSLLLRSAMLYGGFQGIKTEWRHFEAGDTDGIRGHCERID